MYITLREFRFPAIRTNAPTLLSFSGYTHAHANTLLLLLKEVEKTFIFTQKWLDHQLLITSYLVTIATEHHWFCLKMRARDKQTATENVRCFLYCPGKNSEKTTTPAKTSEGWIGMLLTMTDASSHLHSQSELTQVSSYNLRNCQSCSDFCSLFGICRKRDSKSL